MDDELDFLRPSKVFFLDTNLSSPVLTTELNATRQMIQYYYNDLNKKTPHEKIPHSMRNELSFLKKLCKSEEIKSRDLLAAPQLTPFEYPLIEEYMLETPQIVRSFYDEAKEIARRIEYAVGEGLSKRGLPKEAIVGTSELFGHPIVLPYRNAYEQVCNAYARAENKVKESEHVWTRGVIGSCEWFIHNNYGMIRRGERIWTSSANQLLMLKDKLATRYMLLEHVLPLRLKSDLLIHLTQMFKWQDNALKHYGDDAYELLKAIEPMYKTRLSHVTDTVFGEDTAYNRMIVKMKDKETKVIKAVGVNAKVIDKLIALIEKVETLDELVEMFGCQKSCGHPIIDPELGGLSAASEARSPDRTSLVDAQRLRNTFCHIILTSYIGKNGKWPPLKYLKNGTTLEVLNARQERDITYNTYDLSDWNNVEWGKLFDMDYFPNFLELMDDKAISFKRSEKHATWDKNVKLSSQRRLLLETLLRKKIDIEAIVKRVSARDIPWDWFIVSLYPKEREFKKNPRMFAMLCLEMRCFFTCIEANIADHVFKYMPQQTMTKSKTQIQERFLAFTDPSRDTQNHTLFLEIDLSRWNLRWRQMVIHMLGHDMNNMFGVKGTFTVTHWFFSLAQILVRVPGLRPAGIELQYPPETGLAWRKHLGGFEGLNQKLWTAGTYAMIEMALASLLKDGSIRSYELIGQGDNQVLRLSIPKSDVETESEILIRIRDRVNDLLEKTCASVNQEVKPEENVESRNVLTYSKEVFITGVEYPTTLKKHSRLFPVTSSDFPSTVMNASAIMAGAVAAAENSRHTLCSAVVGWYHTARYLLSASAGYSIHGTKGPKYATEAIIAALIIPPSLGGYIGTPIASFMYKGGSDPLGKEVSSVRLIADSRCEVGSIARRALRGLEDRYCIDPEPDPMILIDNPFSLPIWKNASPLSKVSHLTLSAFRPKVLNQDIKPLLENPVLMAETALKKDILAITPFNPILAHDLFEASGFGTVKTMRKMFLNTRTVQSVAQWVNPNITHVFLRADLNDQEWFLEWFKGLPSLGYSRRDSYALVTQFRGYWGRSLAGVTSYQPLDCIHSPFTSRNPSSLKWSSHSHSDLLYERGPLSGYIGTSTRQKRSEHGYKIVDSGTPSRAMMTLQLIRSQAHGDVNFNELLDRIGLTRTNCLLSQITDLLDKVVGGTMAHKYWSVIRDMFASYVGPLNFITHLRLDTDSMGKISGSVDDYSFFSQEHMIMTLFGAKLLHIHMGARIGELLIDTSTMVPIPGDALVCNPPSFLSASLPKSKLLFTPNLMLAKTYDSVVRSVPRGSIALPSQYTRIEYIEMGFVGFFNSLLRDKNKAKLLADTRGLAALPASIQIDIAEAHALGPVKLAKCVARAIFLTTLRDTFRTLHIHRNRWDEALFLVSTISVCVASFANYLRHPMFSFHPDSKYLRGSELRYGSSMSTRKRVEALVRRHLSEMSQNHNHIFWSEPVPSFAEESSMTVAETLTTSAAKHLYRLYQISDPRAVEFSRLYASYTRLPTGTSLSPDQQLSLVRTRLTQLASVISKAGDIILAREIRNIALVKSVLVFNDDAKTIMRYARTLYVEEGQPRPRKLRKTSVRKIPDSDVCPQCLPPATTTLYAMWKRYSLRPRGGLTSSGYTWLPLLAEMSVQKNVMIIGSGNGGLADLLLSCFDCEVVGLDLEEDMPREAATLLNYVPVAIQPQNSSGYTQSDLSITTTGDWFSTEVRSQILSSIVSTVTLYIDITIENVPEQITGLRHAMATELVERVYIRVEGNDAYLSSLCSSLKGEYGVRAWCSSRSYHSSELILEVVRDRLSHLHICGPSRLLESHISMGWDCVIPQRTKELMEAASCNVISWSGEDTIGMCRLVSGLMISLLNKDRRRQLLYRDRIALIEAHLTFYLSVQHDPLTVLQEWISDEMCETDLIRFRMSSRVLSHVSRYVPRLISHQTSYERT